MLIFLMTLLATLWSIFRSRASLGLENLALRHQIGVLHRSAAKRLKLASGDLSFAKKPQELTVNRVTLLRGPSRIEAKSHLDHYHHRHRLAVSSGWLELPLPDGFHGIVVQTKRNALKDRG